MQTSDNWILESENIWTFSDSDKLIRINEKCSVEIQSTNFSVDVCES